MRNFENELEFKVGEINNLLDYCNSVKKENEDKIIDLQGKIVSMERDTCKQEDMIKVLTETNTATNNLYKEEKLKCENYITILD